MSKLRIGFAAVLLVAVFAVMPAASAGFESVGTVMEFSAGITAASNPLGIAAGPDGNLWFTEQTGNRIGRITTTGTVTEFSAGTTAKSGPSGIAKGPDGNLWFTELSGNRIGRITPGGTVTGEFSAGITGSGMRGIAAGPDGNLWFTEQTGPRIGRITPTGTVTEFSAGIKAGSTPTGIAAGPDGNLWFTEFEGNQIGRIIAHEPPHFYSNHVILPEESGGPGAEGKDFIAFGSLMLTTRFTSPIRCLNEFGGDAFNPTGGGAGEGRIDAWIPFDCTEEDCEAVLKSKPEILPEGLNKFGEWEAKLTEAVAGKIRLKWGNSTLGSPTQMKFLVECPNAGAGEFKFKAKGELSPLVVNGTLIGSAPSKQNFEHEAGELEVQEPPVKGEGEVNGSLRTMGYETGEIISAKNP
jgi:hypothetical protein